jgi:hypothetical protein
MRFLAQVIFDGDGLSTAAACAESAAFAVSGRVNRDLAQHEVIRLCPDTASSTKPLQFVRYRTNIQLIYRPIAPQAPLKNGRGGTEEGFPWLKNQSAFASMSVAPSPIAW